MRIEPNPRFHAQEPGPRPGAGSPGEPGKTDGVSHPVRDVNVSAEAEGVEDAPHLPAEIIGDGVFVPEAVLRRERLRSALEESHPVEQAVADTDTETPDSNPRSEETGKPRLPDVQHAREAGRKVIQAISKQPLEETHDALGTDAATVRKLLDPRQ